MAAPVDILTLAEKPVEQTSEFVGTLKSRRANTVQSQMEGFLLKINVKPGDRVAPGTVMFEIDATSQQAAVSSLESIRAARESDAAFARTQADRAVQLLKVGAMSQQEHDQAQAQLRAAEAQLKAVDEQIKQQRNEWSYSRVTAATAGVVGDIPVRVGDRITRATLLTTLEDNSGLELNLNVPVQEAPRLKLGLPVALLDEGGATIGTERIAFISPSVDDATQTVLVKTPVSRTGLRADQFVRARIVWTTAPGLTVPIVAVSRISGQFFVFVAEPANGGLVARQRPVGVGPMTGNDYLITSGLKPGDRVVIAGVQKIGDGAPIAEGPPSSAPPPGPKQAEPGKAGGS
jgi:RND family efflux transporter MFP subunit